MYSRTYKAAVAIPPIVWVTGFLLVPYAILFCYSFWSVSAIQTVVHNWNLQNYFELARNPLYRDVLFRSMRIAAAVTVFALLLGYPLAYYLSFYATRRKELLYQLVIIPLWASYLVRGYAWKTILGNDGVLNGLLRFTHATDLLLWIQNQANGHLAAGHQINLVPLPFLLYSPFAVVLVLTHIYTPFVILPIYASLEHIPRNLVEASHDLGASPWSTFRRVIFPLSLPGVIAGATFAFVLSLGDFLAPLLVGGSGGIMISNIVAGLFGAAYNWPLGAAIAFCMMVIVMALLFATERLEKRLKSA